MQNEQMEELHPTDAQAMEVTMTELSELTKVSLREVWEHEARVSHLGRSLSL